jgi:hypothetical protein
MLRIIETTVVNFWTSSLLVSTGKYVGGPVHKSAHEAPWPHSDKRTCMDLAKDLVRKVTDETLHFTDLNDKTLLGGGRGAGLADFDDAGHFYNG